MALADGVDFIMLKMLYNYVQRKQYLTNLLKHG